MSAAATLAACGGETSLSSQDCNGIIKLAKTCDVRFGGIDPDRCVHTFTFLPPTCIGAVRTYLSCADNANCRALRSGIDCLQEDQSMEIACATGNFTVVTGWDGNTTTRSRDHLARPLRTAPWRQPAGQAQDASIPTQPSDISHQPIDSPLLGVGPPTEESLEGAKAPSVTTKGAGAKK